MGGCWGGAATRRGRFWCERERERTICFADDQGLGAANGNVSSAVSIRIIPAGKGLEELNCVSSSCRLCLCQTPAPEWWLVPPSCGWGWPRPPWAPSTCRVCGERGELSCPVPGPTGVQRGGITSLLLAGIKQAATNPSVSLHLGCLVFLGLGGHSSRYCLCCQLRHWGFVLGHYRLVSLPLPWSCHIFFSHSVGRCAVPSHDPWVGLGPHPLPTRLVLTLPMLLSQGRAFPAVFSPFKSKFFLHYEIQSLLSFFIPKPSPLPGGWESPSPWPPSPCSWGAQPALTPAASALGVCAHTPPGGPKPSLGPWPPLLRLHWDSAELPHEVFRTWSSPAPQSFCWSLHSPLSSLQFSWRSTSWTELSSQCYVGIKINQGVLSRGISVILHSHGCQQSHSCKQVFMWFGEW